MSPTEENFSDSENVEGNPDSTLLEDGQLAEIAPSKSHRNKIIAVLAGLALVVVIAGAWAFTQLSGGGKQPEEFLPYDTVAFAKVDLNPSAAQKIDFIRFISQFHHSFKNFNSGDPVGSIVKSLNVKGTTNWDQIKPWIGNRFAVAGVDGPDGVAPVGILAVSNQSEMAYYFAKHATGIKYIYKSGYVLIADSQGVLDILAAAPKHLSENQTFTADVKALGISPVVLAWADVKQLAKSGTAALDSLTQDAGISSLNGAIDKLQGRLVFGVHFTPKSVSAVFLTRDSGLSANTFTSKRTDLSNLPLDTLAGISIAGLGESIAKALVDNGQSSTLSDFGLSVAELKQILSGPLTIVVLPGATSKETPLLAVKLSPTQPAQAIKIVRNLIDGNFLLSGLASQIKLVGNDIYIGTDAKALAAVIKSVNDSKQHLSDSGSFKSVIPSPGFFQGFLNIKDILTYINSTGSFNDLGDLTNFSFLGLSTSADSSTPGGTKTLLSLSLK